MKGPQRQFRRTVPTGSFRRAYQPYSFQPKKRYRTVWISDIHLGTSGGNADLLVDFLHAVECDTPYLVGDIIDG